MPKIILKNSSGSFTVVNEVKVGELVDGSCDSRLAYFGPFSLKPGEEQLITDVGALTVDVYWKNVKEYGWTHKSASRFDDKVYVEVSTLEESTTPVDICKQRRKRASGFTSGQVIREYQVARNTNSSEVDTFGPAEIHFSTPDGVADFTLHVEAEKYSRYDVYHGQAVIYHDGFSGMGPYILSDGNIRKIYIHNGVNGAVHVKVVSK